SVTHRRDYVCDASTPRDQGRATIDHRVEDAPERLVVRLVGSDELALELLLQLVNRYPGHRVLLFRNQTEPHLCAGPDRTGCGSPRIWAVPPISEDGAERESRPSRRSRSRFRASPSRSVLKATTATTTAATSARSANVPRLATAAASS